MTLVHEIHSSQLRGYRTCRRMWNWRYIDNWEPVKRPAPLEDGTVWHKAMEVLYNPDTWNMPLKDLHASAQAALIAEAERQRKDYLHRAGKYLLDEEEAIEYDDRISILRSMLVKLCRSLDRSAYKPLFVEKEFACAVLDEAGSQLYCHCDTCHIAYRDYNAFPDSYRIDQDWEGLPVTFNCRIDAVFEDREGFVFVVDHKSAANLYKADSVIPELEDQLPSYLWCVRQNGYPATGIILNQFRKAYPKPPKRLTTPGQGRWYSVNKAQLTDYHTARQVFERHDNRAYRHGLYNDYLEWLKTSGPEYSRQFTMLKTEGHLEQIGRDIYAQAKEVTGTPAVYPNGHQMVCQSCSFQLPCLTASGGGDPTEDLEAGFVKSEPYYIQRRLQS